jgi:hypothetical protein
MYVAFFYNLAATKWDLMAVGIEGSPIGGTDADAVHYDETTTANMDFVVDEDDMASDSATKLPTQQSVKAYVDDLGASALVRNEVPAGTINSSNTAFTLASAPTTGSLRVYLNGVRQKVTDDYTTSGTGITFVTAPPTGSNLLADYEVSSSTYTVGTNSYIAKEAVTGSINGSNAVFTTARAYIAGSLQVFVNGLMQSQTMVTETTPSTGTFTLDTAPVTGDVIHVAYQYNLNPSGNADTVDGIHASTTATANQLYPLNSSGVFDGSVLGGASTTWTPTWTGLTIGNGTLSANYFRIGKLIVAKIHLKFGTTTTVSGNVQFTLPVTGATSMSTLEWNRIGIASLTDEGTAVFDGSVHTNSSATTASIYVSNAAGTNVTLSNGLGGTVPHTWASTDKISLIILYEAA